jgi:uncharacterized protein YutD
MTGNSFLYCNEGCKHYFILQIDLKKNKIKEKKRKEKKK